MRPALSSDSGENFGTGGFKGRVDNADVGTDPCAIAALPEDVSKEIDVVFVLVDEDEIDLQVKPVDACLDQSSVGPLDRRQHTQR